MAQNNGRQNKESEGGVKDSNRANWSKEILHLFCDLCIEYAEKNKGKRGALVAQRMPWKILEVEFHKRTNLAYDRNKLKNKWDWMRNKWILWRTLKGNETDLGWDHEKGTISASQEWWKKKIEENMHFKAFQDEGVEPELDIKMEQLFGGSLAQRVHKFTPVTDCAQLAHCGKETIFTSSPPRNVTVDNEPHDFDEEISENNVQAPSEANMKWQEVSNDCSPILCPTPLRCAEHGIRGRESKRVSENDASQNTKRCKTEFAIMEKLDAIMRVVIERNNKEMESMNLGASTLAVSSPTLVESLAKVVAMPDLIHGSPEFCFACTLIEDPQKRTILHGIPDDYSRLQWIKFLYAKHGNK
ncbi:hypothetical protein BVRB_8g199310 [Beta vulgaris subsp. vulgaris]|uniref:L10-interacting MYB domain-containing protein n=1 Tax=Beta vulgaris subsp. vulgaris TaxID=3555 RepID=UPI00053F6F48|nr:L10-interacting MYB domain-containing protein [Beta vulgaris subsp. vulgaris]XP_010696548.1 L10-interacting MYB domain-containing protein [Beta vulgaris subsp. vulgaris]XP_048490620.1 L10-interacting MYB domain-containing protein [Beta vulgaris subsp. vulgaris]KMS96855.1 hypothetical protein BVRB_8g199310 [Beta vulgaris subsp. vulgaris]